jgi:hypothetical protein
MTVKHAVLGFTLFAVAAVGCGSSGGSNGGNDGGGAGGGGGGNMCAPTGASSCTQAEVNTYNTCVQNACNTQFVACYGPNYKSGSFGGACASYAQCQNACGCTDTTCRNACTIPATCMSCLTTIGTCTVSSGCAIPACFGGGFDGGIPGLDGGFPFDAGNFTCADLTACCNAITDADEKQGCQLIVSVNNQLACSLAVSGYKTEGLCP